MKCVAGLANSSVTVRLSATSLNPSMTEREGQRPGQEGAEVAILIAAN